MTQELINKLIAHYEEVIEQIKNVDSVENAENILFDTYTVRGICNCASCKFDVSISSSEWVKNKVVTGSFYWANPAEYGQSIPEIISLLQIRVDILKQFPN